MDRDPQPKPLDDQEAEISLEAKAQHPIHVLPEILGFIETTELGRLHSQLVEAYASESGEVSELAARYHILAEEVVSQREGEDYTKAQIGLIVQMSLIRRDGGKTDQYIEDLQDAATYAWNMQLDDTVATIETAIEEARGLIDQQSSTEVVRDEPTVEQLAQVCSEVLSAVDYEELVTMPMEEALGYAFTLLIESGVDDPEVYLKSKGILE